MGSEGDRSDGRFSFARRDDGTVIISYGAAPVRALHGHVAERFVARLDRTDAAAAQELMARIAAGGSPRADGRR